MNLSDYLTHNSRIFREKLALAHGMAPFASWRELRQRAEKLATGIGLPLSSRAAIESKNCPEYVEILFACWAAGLIVVPINAKLHKREVELLECSKASMVFVSEEIETCPDRNQTVTRSPCLVASQ
ncbi:class I adenylate-forming enzyme family protein [Parasphingorhabdus sp.]|uniref:class I adenylate-forming enzyme family protein n=1 Tax=Parasphingorhabdus sp. TaxID=2709688 RepID=UPI0030028CD3